MKAFLFEMRRCKFWMLLAFIAAATLLMSGCGGSDSYNEPVVTRTATPLIEPETLKAWMDQGLVNADEFENVVVLHMGSPTDPAIPGAYVWNTASELGMTRVEGLGDANSSVVTGSVMDQVLQRSGVNRYSTIVLTGTGPWQPDRAYFTLRYWGFPKERIKLLNGGNAGWTQAIQENAWDAATYGLTTMRPGEHTSNNFSVRENGNIRADLRYSLGEMIQTVDANLASIAATGQPVVNIVHRRDIGQPTLATAIQRDAGWFFESGRFYRDAEGVRGVLLNEQAGVGPGVGDFVEGLPTITHCASGMSCAPIFFALDAILGWDVAIFDGSTNLWNAYKAKAEGTTGVVPNDAWRTDLFGRTPEGVGTTTTTDVIVPVLNNLFLSVEDPRANQIENEDAEYMKPAVGGPPTSVGGGDASGC